MNRLLLALMVVVYAWLATTVRSADALQGADIAVYVDTGAWSNGVVAITNMLSWMGFSHETIYATDVNAATQDFSTLYRALIFPGGNATYYNMDITSQGKQRIRRFVRTGGGYFGICAGSFFACDVTLWDGVGYDDAGGYNLDMFPGTGTGPINEIADWYAEGYNMCTFRATYDTGVLGEYKSAPFSEDILYYGGPAFTIPDGFSAEVLAVYDYEGTYSNQPAAIAFRYGDGRLVLFGPHPEIEEDSDRDGVTIDREDEMADAGSDWTMVRHCLDWITGARKSTFLSIACPSNSPVSLSWQAPPLRPSELQRSTDLLSWSPVATVSSNHPERSCNTALSRGNTTFYRITASLCPMARVSGGTFTMGDNLLEGQADERPAHQVTVDTFLMDITEVTCGHMARVMQWAYDNGYVVVGGTTVTNTMGSPQALLDLHEDTVDFDGGSFRAVQGQAPFPCPLVSWYGAQAFCAFRSMLEGLEPCVDLATWTCTMTNRGYRLPTEAEWEYAARGGAAGQRYAWGATIDGSMANYLGSGDPYEPRAIPSTPVRYYDDLQVPAGSDMTNGFGLYDMAGNLWEWCGDWYGAAYYQSTTANNPTGPLSGTDRVARGGSWFNAPGTAPNYLRCSVRLGTLAPSFRGTAVGFRCVRRPSP